MSSNANQETGNKHCMVVHAYYPLGETRVERQAQALVAQGINVDVICLGGPKQPAISNEEGVQVYRLSVQRYESRSAMVQLVEYLIFFVLALVRLTSLHWKKSYDVVQVHNLPDFLVFTALIPKLSGAKVILDLHDLMPEFYAERFQKSLDSLPVRLVRWQERLSCRFANHIITVTEHWRQSLIARGYPESKITVVMNVADDRIFNHSVTANVSNHGRFCLIYHGNVDQRYGLDLALRALSQVQATVPDILFILHGGGKNQDALENLVDELGLEDCVQFSTRFMPTADLPGFLKQADLAVVPYREGVFTSGILPTKLMEYAALGIPAIAARTAAIEAYFDDTMVEFFEPEDVDGLASCILKLYNDPKRLADLAQGIEEFNQRYHWPQISKKYVALVRQLEA